MEILDFISQSKNEKGNTVEYENTDGLREEVDSRYKMLCELIGDEEKKRFDVFLTRSNLLNSLLFFDTFTMGFGCGLRFKGEVSQKYKENEKNL